MKFKLKDASATDIERLSTLIAKAMSPSIKEILAAFKTEEGNFICTDFLTPGRTVSLPMDLDPNTDLAPLKTSFRDFTH
ncbi:MAG UNVERIFIED_CONTAM: hypothetical protein LVQ98_02880 [Rickettsiaceae bacterium]|jgi:hypothetical protein